MKILWVIRVKYFALGNVNVSSIERVPIITHDIYICDIKKWNNSHSIKND